MTGDKLSIGPMLAGDIPDIIDLEVGTLSAWSREHLEDELRQPAGFQFVARSEEEGKPLAVLCGRIVAEEAEILKLSVAENARNKGIGIRLLEFALDYCRAKGVKDIFLEMRVSNRLAGKLYEKKGFSRAGIRRNYYHDPVEDAIMMRLALKQR